MLLSLNIQKLKGSDTFFAPHSITADPITHKGSWFAFGMPDFATMAIVNVFPFPLLRETSWSTKAQEEQKSLPAQWIWSEQAVSAGRDSPRVSKMPDTNPVQGSDSLQDSYMLIYLAEFAINLLQLLRFAISYQTTLSD